MLSSFDRIPEFRCDSCKRFVTDDQLEDTSTGTYCFNCLAEMMAPESVDPDEEPDFAEGY